MIKKLKITKFNVNFNKEILVKFLLLILLIITLYFFYKPLLNNWFRSDDLYLMWASSKLSIFEIFFVPEKHRLLSSNFNPMYGLSFKLDWLLFKMDASGYAIHCIISTILSSIMLFLLLRTSLNIWLSFCGVLFFLLNPLTLNMTGLFFRRHYTEGLLFSLLSIYLFIISEEKRNAFSNRKILSSLCYLISALYREIYVILPAIIFLNSKGETLSKKLKSTILFWFVLVIYSIWRLSIREGLGGYPSNQSFLSIENLKIIPQTINSFAIYWSPNFHTIGYIYILLFLLSAIKYPRFIIIFLILFIPILPVSNIMNYNPLLEKYYYHLVVFFIIATMLLINNPPFKFKSFTKIIISILIFYFFFIFIKYDLVFINSMRYESSIAKKTAMEYIYSGKPFIKAQQPYWFYIGLKNINQQFYNREIKTEIIPPEEFIKYSKIEKLNEMIASGVNLDFNKILEAQKSFKEGPLYFRIKLDNFRLSWKFGPFEDKTYTFLRSPISGLYYNKSELKSEGTYMLASDDNNAHTIFFRVLYNDNGHEIISPEFELKIPSNQLIEYKK